MELLLRRHGQITLFFLLGLVLLLVIGIFLYLTLPRPAPDGIDNSDVVASVVGACLDAIVNDELRLLGETGALPADERFPAAATRFGTTERMMLYGVSANRDLSPILPAAHSPPRYPDTAVPIERSDHSMENGALVRFQPLQDGYFGDVNFPGICDPDGANRPGSEFRCRNYPGNPPGTEGPSVQEMLERRIAQRVRACADPDRFSQAMGQPVMRVEEPVVNVTFTPSNTLVVLTYPLLLEDAVQQTVAVTTRTYRVRFLPVMQFAVDLAREESRNVSFDPATHYRDIPSFRDGFSVSVQPVPASDRRPALTPQLHEQASLVLITDTRSQVDGASYAFGFLVEHRPPMLNEFTQPHWEAMICPLFRNSQFAGNAVNGIVTGMDPDGDTLMTEFYADGEFFKLIVTADDGADWKLFPKAEVVHLVGRLCS